MNEPTDRTAASEQQFADKAKQLFDGSVEQLDAATLSRLNQGRHVALEELHRSRSTAAWIRWLPATGVAAAAIVTVMVMRGPASVDIPVEPDVAADFEILLEDESLEMLEELEFYSWLEAADLDENSNVG